MAFEETFLTVKGCRIRLRRSGSGPSMVYLHGADGAALIAPFMTKLSEQYDLLVPEHPGYGQSEEIDWLENIHDLAYFYLDLFDHLKLGEIHLVGSSIGGWLAMEIAVRNPERIRSMTLVGPAGIRAPGAQPGDIFLWSHEQLVANLFHSRAIVERVLALPVTEADQDIRLKNRHTTALLAWEPRLHDPHLAKWIHRANMPVRIVWGAQDKVMPLAWGQKLVELMPHASLQVFDQCGHLPQIEYPEAFCAAVAEVAK